jgi:hypothetical protein
LAGLLPCRDSAPASDVLLGRVDEIFNEDKAFTDQCTFGLNKQLTRTADGANDKLRINELAQIVKTLRRCVRTYQEKVISLKNFIVQETPSPGINISPLNDDEVSRLKQRLASTEAALDAANKRALFLYMLRYRLSVHSLAFIYLRTQVSAAGYDTFV